MKKFYLHNGTEQEGPFSKSELKEKNITRKTEVWYEGLNDWTNAENVDDLKNIFNTSSPPPIRSKVVDKKKKTKSWKGILIKTAVVSVLIIVGLQIYADVNDRNYETYSDKVMTIEEIENATPANFLDAHGTYNESFWGTKINVDGKISNSATVADYKDVVVRVTYYSKTKTVLGTEDYTLYEVFPPNSVKPFKLKIENYKDVNSIGWDVISALPN
jgi:hypothetical protein